MNRIKNSCALVMLMLTALPCSAAEADISVETVIKKLEGNWLAKFIPALFSRGIKVPFQEFFLDGTIGAVWRFEQDGKLVVYLPCDINQRFRKGDIALGDWKLDAGKTLRLRAQLLIESKDIIEIEGPLEFDSYPSKQSGEGTMTVSSSQRSMQFGRYDGKMWFCN